MQTWVKVTLIIALAGLAWLPLILTVSVDLAELISMFFRFDP